MKTLKLLGPAHHFAEVLSEITLKSRAGIQADYAPWKVFTGSFEAGHKSSGRSQMGSEKFYIAIVGIGQK